MLPPEVIFTRSRGFLAQAPLALLAIITVYFALEMPVNDDTGWRAKLRRVDFLGAFILVAAVLTLLLGLDRGSNLAWRDATTIGLLCMSLVLLLLFVFVEIRVATEPFAPGHIIFERSLFACYLCNFFSFGGWMAAIFYIPLFYQAVDGLSATQAGLRLLPAIVAGVTGSLLAGVIMKKTGRYYWLTVAAYSALLAGFVPILLFTGLVVTSTWGISVGTMICGFGNGIGVTSSLIALRKFIIPHGKLTYRSKSRLLHAYSIPILDSRPSRGDSVFISLSFHRIRHRGIVIFQRGAAVTTSPSPTITRQWQRRG